MPSKAELTAAEYDTVEALPASARALLGGDFFSTPAWYRTVIAAGLPDGARAVLLVLSGEAGSAGLFPMMVSSGRTGALSTPYTCLWRPMLAPGLNNTQSAQLWRGFAAWCRGHATVRLEALDEAQARAITAALVGTGLVTLRFNHFANWHEERVRDWPSYLAGRPGAVREAVRRRSRQLLAQGAAFRIVRTPDEIDAGIAAYEQVYATSWKAPEPYPAFNGVLMRACAAEGSLRLGLLRVQERVLAAQIWVVRQDWAAVLKLAHDEDARALSPGTVLTAMMIEHLMAREGVRTLDFGRGDDPYKQSWTTKRRQRVGLLLANMRRPAGLRAVAQHLAGRAKRQANLQKFFASFFQERRTFFRKTGRAVPAPPDRPP